METITWGMFLKKYWFEILLVFIGSLFVYYVTSLQKEIVILTADRDMYKTALEYQNTSLLQQKTEYDEKLSKLPTEIEKIKVRYEVIYKSIDDWKGDMNASDCNNTDTFLRSTIY